MRWFSKTVVLARLLGDKQVRFEPYELLATPLKTLNPRLGSIPQGRRWTYCSANFGTPMTSSKVNVPETFITAFYKTGKNISVPADKFVTI
jgi:hypothetical protein